MNVPHNFLLSVVIPVFNEEGNIDTLLERLTPILEPYKHEIILVDDGSKDKTIENIKKHTSHNPNLKVLSFYRNFGHQMALMCGYQHAQGDCVISLDADLQDPPEIIPEMIEKWKQGAKIVYAKRISRDVDNIFKKYTAKLFYDCMNFLSEVPIPEDVGDFRLLDRDVVNFLKNLPEQSRFLRGLVAWSGYSSEFVTFERQKRHAGKTHYPISKMINFAMDGITSFSTKPLRVATYLGFFAASIGFIGVLYAIMGRIFTNQWVTGWTGLFVGIMFIGGVQLITIGIIGEYISKIYTEVQKRPQYIIREKINV